MEKRIKIFKSFEEQDAFHAEKMCSSTVMERFQHLFRMQQLTSLFHPVISKERKITIRKNGYPQ